MIKRYSFILVIFIFLGIFLFPSCKSDKKSTAKVDQKEKTAQVEEPKEKKETKTKKKKKSSSSTKSSSNKTTTNTTKPTTTTTKPRTTTTTTTRPPTTSSTSNSQQSLLSQINSLRTNGCQCGGTTYPPVPPLRWSSKLASAARSNASSMSSSKRLGHGDIGGNIKRTGYSFSDAAQNISDHSSRFHEVIGNWRRSKTNCKDIMKRSFTEIGIAQVNGYWTQILATPRGSSSGSVASRPSTSSSSSSGGSSSGSSSAPISNLKGEMLREVNALRSAGCTCGGRRFGPVPPLAWNSSLESASKKHASDMARTGNLSHTGSDGSKVATRVMKAGYNYKAIAENVSQGRPSVRAAVASWKASSSHCKNMMNREFKDLGAAKVGPFWVQNFGAR